MAISRRLIVTGGVGLFASTLTSRKALARPAQAGAYRQLSLRCETTDETFCGTYWCDGTYRADAMAALRHMMRDRHDGKCVDIAPSLIDQLSALQAALHGREITLTCGVRSAATNRRLRAEGEGAAAHSLHLCGKAADIRVQGFGMATLHAAARSIQTGGLGFYPHRRFLHLDVGPKRSWIA
jgi:uncharacterized protein YcbK (DUF882 family)